MIHSVRLLCVLALLPGLLWGADHRATAADVVRLVFTSLYSDQDDTRLAQELSNLQLSERLGPHVVAYFQNAGVGVQTSGALQRMRDESAPLPAPAELPFSIQPLPPESEQKEILKKVRGFAQSYVKGLPNFLCDQVTRRYTNLAGNMESGNLRFSDQLHASDEIKENLRFVNGTEQGTVSNQRHERAASMLAKKGHSLSRGEFGSDISNIFGSGVTPSIHWHHWETFDGKRTAVFSYHVQLRQSRYTLVACCMVFPMQGEVQQRVTAPIQGLAYVDVESGAIRRLTIEAVSLPAAFWIKENRTVIDYAGVKIGNQIYTLPVRALVFIASVLQNTPRIQRNLNEIAFLNYRKFEAESVLTYSNSKITYGPSTAK